MDADGYGGTVRLVPLDTVDVDHPLLAVDLGDLALTTGVLSPRDSDLVVSADGERASLSRLSELGQYSGRVGRTLYLPLRSFESGEDMIFRRMEEGAEKCAFRFLRLDEVVSVEKACR